MRKSMHKYCQCCVSPLSKPYTDLPAFKSKFKFSSSPEVTEAELMGKPGYPRCSPSSMWRCVLEPDVENPPKIVAVWRVWWQVLSERTGGSSGNDMSRPLHFNMPLTPTLSCLLCWLQWKPAWLCVCSSSGFMGCLDWQSRKGGHGESSFLPLPNIVSI